MRIRVDPLKCQGHARCFALAPELFEVDDYGMSTVKGDGMVPVDLEERALLAVDNCPEFAIEAIIEDVGRDPGRTVSGTPHARTIEQ